MLYSDLQVDEVRKLLRERRKVGDVAGGEAVKEKYLRRMWDLSQFMKTLKQRFTQWFNRKHERRGTLWEDRFKSVIVEDGYAADRGRGGGCAWGRLPLGGSIREAADDKAGLPVCWWPDRPRFMRRSPSWPHCLPAPAFATGP